MQSEENIAVDYVGVEFYKVLKENPNFHIESVAAVQNPLRDSPNFLDDKLNELFHLSTELDERQFSLVKKIRFKFLVHVLLFGSSWSSINTFLEVSRDDILQLARKVFSSNKNYSVSLLFNLQLMVIAVDYSIANIINTRQVKDSEMEDIEAVKKRKGEAALFFSCWEKFSDQEGFLLVSKAKSFLMKAASLDTCFFCQVPVSVKVCSWDCVKVKTRIVIDSYEQHFHPFFCMIDGEGSVACCGKESCNMEVLNMFQRNLKEFKSTDILLRFKTEYFFSCDFCHKRSSVHRCSACKSRWYCGAECQLDDWVMVHKEICGELGKKGRKQKRFNSKERMRVAGEVTEKRSVKWGREFLNNFFGRDLYK